MEKSIPVPRPQILGEDLFLSTKVQISSLPCSRFGYASESLKH